MTGTGAHDRRPVIKYTAITGAGDFDTVDAMMGTEFLAWPLLRRSCSGRQLVAVLLIDQRSVGEGIVEYMYKPIAHRAEIGVAEWFASMLFGVLIALGCGFRTDSVITVMTVAAPAR